METRKRTVISCNIGGKDLFRYWLNALTDSAGVAAILQRLDRIEGGNFGDYRSIGGGLCEFRVHCGPGYRVYYGEDGPLVVILLCGGDKKSQHKDIRLARRLWQGYRRGK